ncbi:hypothetical protein MKK84_00300 [Methylobacterium sp. E-065]|uniref:hypothetical protein n=1 Tax=Methylobacterium sp. E-065 TaxID=2836583 RepID=UPI001FB8E750|nr:hypothetical protein [Methylobacterium sp. E-065]MCJ2015881.1 hypothetical protein [Methylobacterium sp. E-065]
MKFSLSQAAKVAKKSKGTVSRDIQSGKLSATRLESGGYEIDASELFRVYPPAQSATGSEPPSTADRQPAAFSGELAAEVLRLREMLALMKDATERERRQWSDQVDDLRQRLDREGSERRELMQRLLTYQSPPPAPPDAPGPTVSERRRLWSIFTRKTG